MNVGNVGRHFWDSPFLTLTQTWHDFTLSSSAFNISGFQLLPPSLCTFLVYNVCTQQWPNYEARLWPVLKLNNMSWVKVHAKLYCKAKCFVWACIKVNNRRKYPDGLTLKPCQTSKTQPWWPHWSLISILRRSHTIPKMCFLCFAINSTWSFPDESQKYLCQLTELKIGP